VSLAENPFRESHLAWIKRHRPRFVWIAEGTSPHRRIAGMRYRGRVHRPRGRLLGSPGGGRPLRSLRGYEAGGHVGQHSTLTLAQMVLDLKRRKPSLFRDCRVILAGASSIGNRIHGRLLGADAIQMAPPTWQPRRSSNRRLTALYRRMIVKSPPGGTSFRVRALDFGCAP